MQGTEFIMLLAGFSAAILLLFSFNSMLLDSGNYAMKSIQVKSESQECAFLADEIYANSVQKIERKINCIILEGKATSTNEGISMNSELLNKKTRTAVKKGKTSIKVESDGHYR
ncbi:MAG: hypothetical protein ABIA76_03700 [Candidatus Diapherotrites archaeon]